MDPVYINLEEGLGRIRGNKSLYKRMLQMYLASPEFEKLETCFNANDAKGAAEVSHAIKGMVGNLGLTALFEISTALMNSFRAGNWDEALIDSYRLAEKETRIAVNETLTTLD